MIKTIIKAKNITIGKEIEVEIMNANYNEDCVEVKIIEGTFKNSWAVVNKNDIVKYEVELTMEQQVVELCKEMELRYDNGIENEITIEGYDYTIYVSIDEDEKCFDLSTLNTNINWEDKAEEDIYFDMSDAYKNQASRKTLKAVKSYIEKYVG